ncbi:hypothetical protein B0H21DRAFT_82739 [Amylocystis lapponica]|nr:hypothetical protein B0H21DRAFT_82739 [Amylocystis lapponica]
MSTPSPRLADWIATHRIVLDPVAVEDSDAWPEPVRELATSLTHPLPGWVSSGPYPWTCPQNMAMLSTLTSTLPLKLTHPSPEPSLHLTAPDCYSLRDIFDLILSHTTIFQRMARRSEIRGPMNTDSLLQSFIGTIFRANIPNTVMIRDATVTLPRTCAPNVADRCAASLLAAHIFPNSQQEELSSSSLTSGSSGGDSDEYPQNDHPFRLAADYEHTNSAHSSDSSIFDSSVHYHMLASPSHSELLVPVLCVGTPDSIIPLMVSALYQRYVLHVSEPVIGILFSGNACKILFGWSESGLEEDKLPIKIHISSATSCGKYHAAAGIFNLEDATSAVALANFLLGLKPHSDRIYEAVQAFWCSPNQEKVYSWRADSEISDGLCGNEEWNARVVRWVEGAISAAPPDIDPHPNVSTSSDYNPISPDISRSDDTSTRQPSPLGPRGARSASVQLGSLSQLSASVFAEDGKLSKNKTGIPTIGEWLQDMNVLIVPGIPGVSKAVDMMISTYERITDLVWPEDWTTPDEMPPVDRIVDPLRALLQTEINSDEHRKPRLIRPDDTLASMISSRLSALLSAAQSAMNTHSLALRRGAYEAERRLPLDYLLLSFLSGGTEDQSSLQIDALSERVLSLPRNSSHDAARRSVEEWYSDQHARAVSDASQAFAFAGKARESRATIPLQIHAQMALAYFQALNVQHKIASKDITGANKDKVLQELAVRTKRYPEQAKCDMVVTLAIPNFLKQLISISAEKLSRGFPIVHHPVAETEASWSPLSISTSSSQVSQSSRRRTPSLPTSRWYITKSAKIQAALKPIEDLELVSHSRTPKFTPLADKQLNALHSILTILRLHNLSVHNTHSERASEVDSDLLLPVLVVEYKKKGQAAEEKATNQHRMYSTAIAQFLHEVGIDDFAIFSLVADGTVGNLAMSWYSGQDKRIYIMEQCLQAFDISTVSGAYHFATVLARLQDHARDLEKKFGTLEKQFYEKVKTLSESSAPQWTKSSQYNEFGYRELDAEWRQKNKQGKNKEEE